MTKDELLQRLRTFEWTDVEFKEAQRAAPRSAYETVSAFANTAGGRLVFGVRDEEGTFTIVGVVDVDKVQGEFLSTIRSGQKLNREVRIQASAVEHEHKTLLVFLVPELPRSEKPLYLDGDIRRAFIRRGGCDERCTQEEIERFLRDAAQDRYDGQALDELDAEEFFDPSSVRWYRRVFDERNPGREQAASDLEFLNEWGFVIEHGDRLVPTRAAVLLFGRARYLRQILPRPVVDCQFIGSAFDAWSPDHRWQDRIVVEENLVQAWLALSERYAKHADRPFGLDAATLRRDDAPPDYISFREAAINLLIHQDYGDHGRKASIRFFRDRTLFWNPGDAFATTDELLDPTEKEVRNPAIVAAFRRIGLSEQAGTGVRAIFRSWQRLGHVPPVIENDKARKTFELRLLREELLSEEQRLFQARLGVRLDEPQARLFAFAFREGGASITDAKAVTGRNGPEARKVLESLVVQGLLQPIQEGTLYGLAEHLAGRLEGAEPGLPAGAEAAGNLVTDQVEGPAADLVTDQVVRRLTPHQVRIVQACDVPRSLAELMERVGVTHRTFFRRRHLQPLLDAGIVRMTNPANPPAANQRYVLTEAGAAIKGARIGERSKEEPDEEG
ncbi:MAG: putative DNA binding domain-containing protein [Planctomycetes bacterium]|nr:putative DNA binding domain-containing protein [Planctomycetota bacterium]